MLSPAPSVRPISPRIGAVIDGLDLSEPLDATTLDTIRRALREHLVLVFYDQQLEPAHLQRFGRHFGPMDEDPRHGVPDHREVRIFYSDTTSDPVISHEWHTDSSWLPAPPILSALYLDTVPPMAGMLSFASMHAAYDAMSDAMKTYLEGLTARHDGRLSRYKPSAADPTASHPVIRRHPDTGRSFIYVNSVFTDHIEGLPAPEGRAILDFLFDHIANPFFQVRFDWQPGMIAFWDNRATQHLSVWDCPPRGCSGYRVQIEDR